MPRALGRNHAFGRIDIASAEGAVIAYVVRMIAQAKPISMPDDIRMRQMAKASSLRLPR
ncbi:hypothetical protein [Gemmatimonas groenlandica]|uniref:Uncharacterized protein n=1 Tax=Gemmatimonas groenlandica TaxID=2732249 RepID=A0A6M4IKM2_9BACT|nr:hypothetical protein [Gemmatimonas groenlandica]QJR34077.1 hypothetical protein HKW67_00385 [Gemmatimonas groenlandica]